MARPTKLTPRTEREVATALAAGWFRNTAAAYAGISPATLYSWLSRGERESTRLKNPDAETQESEAPYVRFLESIKKALAVAEVRDLAVISEAAKAGVWQAAAWKLERRHPERWGRKILQEAR